MDFEPLLTPKRAAEVLRISVDTLREHVRSGELCYINVSARRDGRRSMMFDPHDLRQFIQARRSPKAAPTAMKGVEVIGFRRRQALGLLYR